MGITPNRNTCPACFMGRQLSDQDISLHLDEARAGMDTLSIVCTAISADAFRITTYPACAFMAGKKLGATMSGYGTYP